MRQEKNENTGNVLAEKTVEGYIPVCAASCPMRWRRDTSPTILHGGPTKKKGIPKERPVADEETVQRLIAALETQSLKYEVYYKLILATGMRRG